MDIQKTDNSVYIKADKEDNKIQVTRKGNSVEVDIDGEKQLVDGSKPVVIDAGAGNDRIFVSNLPQGKKDVPVISIIGGEGDDSILYEGNVKVADNKGSNVILEDKNNFIANKTGEAKINGFINELETTLKGQKYPFPKEIKDKVINIFERSSSDKTLPDLARELDKQGKLKDLYQDMGSLINQGDAGATASAILGILTLGTTFVAEARSNYAYELFNVLKDGGVDADILNKLRPAYDENKKTSGK